jgi:phytoene dehydrogenase-like protein
VNSCPWVFWGAESTIELQTQFNDITELKLPRYPGGLACTASIHDRTQAPPDKYTTFYWQWTTYFIDGDPKNWDNEEFRNEVLDTWTARWREYAPNLTEENILGRYLYTPTDMEKLTTGHMKFASLMLGDMGLDHMNFFRPFHGVSQYKVPGIDGLYLTGGTTHPTGGIHGASGYNVSNVIAEDLRIRKWWER